MKYSIVLPTYNEAENIAAMIRRLAQFSLPESEIIVVDDHSPDGTATAAERASAAAGIPVRVLLNPGQRGLAPSVVYGFDAAQGDVLICMDADGQHRPEDLPGLLQSMESDGAMLTVGSRHVPGGGFTERWNFFRVLCSDTAALAAKICLGVPIHDPMSGFFAIRRDAYRFVKDEMSPSGFKIMLELAWLLMLGGLTPVTEHPITFDMRRHGSSKLSSSVISQYLAMLARCMKTRGSIRRRLIAKTEQNQSTPSS